MKANEEPGKFTTPAEVRLVHTLPGPIERVRAYLMDLEKRARWLAGGVCEPKVGGKNDLVFQHKNLSPNEEPPEPPSRGVGPCSNFDPSAKTATSRCHALRPRRGSVPTSARFRADCVERVLFNVCPNCGSGEASSDLRSPRDCDAFREAARN